MAPSPIPSPPTKPPSSNPTIPLISLTPLLSTSPTTLPTAHSLLSALRTTGFFYLTDAPIPPPLLTKIFSHSASFFARPQSQKDQLAWTTPQANRGYVQQGREKVSLGTTKSDVEAERLRAGNDQKESFEIGREDDPAGENQWPDKFGDAEGAAFKTAMQDFFTRCQEIHIAILRGLALALHLPPTFFNAYISRADNTLRLLHYPALPQGAFEHGRRVRAGLHTDYGSITLLFQDGRGGLQVKVPDGIEDGIEDGGGRFVDVHPVEGTVVVNSGDLLRRWSCGLVRSTLHRVVEPPLAGGEGGGDAEGGKGRGGGEDGYPARYSIAYFCNPDFDRWIEALPGTWEGEGVGGRDGVDGVGEGEGQWQGDAKEKGTKFAGCWSGEYLVERLSATY